MGFLEDQVTSTNESERDNQFEHSRLGPGEGNLSMATEPNSADARRAFRGNRSVSQASNPDALGSKRRRRLPSLEVDTNEQDCPWAMMEKAATEVGAPTTG